MHLLRLKMLAVLLWSLRLAVLDDVFEEFELRFAYVGEHLPSAQTTALGRSLSDEHLVPGESVRFFDRLRIPLPLRPIYFSTLHLVLQRSVHISLV